ncbi:MAG: hypothetical protein ACI8QZ_001882 [Chlamydiales bacterium]|jgi:hypothetical protein
MPSDPLPSAFPTGGVAPPASQPSDQAWAVGCRVGIMQPYLFPYLGYFQLIDATERWVVFDTPQFIRHGWVNRNRILHPTEGAQYILAPLVKQPRHTPIREMHLADKPACLDRIRGQFQHYRKRAPHFEETIALIEATFAGDETQLCALNVRGLGLCCERLGIAFDVRIFSEMSLELGKVEGPGDWAPRIASALGASSYTNPPGGEDLFDPAQFAELGIDLQILDTELRPYAQGPRPFEAGLSILDVFMWNTPDSARALLTDRVLRPSSRGS